MKKLLLAISILLVQKSFSQTDTAFWFAAPDISSDYGYDRPIAFRVSSFQLSAVVTVSQPANPSFVPLTITLPPFSTQTFFLTTQINNIECGPGNVIQNRGLKITSNNKIAAYYEANVDGPNPELFALKGRNALGTSFYISSQNVLNNATEYTPAALSSFNIVASQDNTSIIITPTKNIVGHSANIPFTIVLNKGQTYAAIASSYLANQHLDGSFVTSTKPIAITLADDLLNGGIFGSTCRDLAGDQTIPINVLGTQYIAIKSNLNFPNDKLFITAVVNNTTVSQDGVLITTINAGQSTTLTVNNPSTYVETSTPAYIYQLAGSGCEVGAAILPKIDCTGSGSISVARSSNESLYITLLVKNGGQANFLINNNSGIITAPQFSTVPGTSGQWYFAKILLSLSTYPNGSIIKIDNTTNLFQMGFLQGNTLGLSFGYFSDYNSVRPDASASNMRPCIGSNITLNSALIPSATYAWTGPGGYTANTSSAVLNNVTLASSGYYLVNVTVPGCGLYKDSVLVTVLPKSFKTINATICVGSSFEGYTTSGTYLNTYVAANGCDSIRTLNLVVTSTIYTTINQSICQGQSLAGYTVSGTYINNFTSSAGCDSIRTLNLIVKPKSFTTINQIICEGQTFAGYSLSGTYLNTFVAANGCDSIRTLNLTVKPKSFTTLNPIICQGQSFEGYTVSGIFVNTFVAANGCDSVRTLNLTVKPKSFTTINANICIGNNFEGYTATGTYVNTFVAANGCDSVRTINLIVHPQVNTTIIKTICEGDVFEGYTQSGIFINTYATTFGCDSVRTLNLTVKPRSFKTITQTICAGQSFEGYNTTGTYTNIFTAANGCDSLRTLQLTVNPASVFTINKTICEGFIFEGYNTSGIYNDTFISANGCDSIRTLNLTVLKFPTPNLGSDTSICFENKFIISPGVFDSYLWQDGSNLNTYTVSSAGLYSVTVTNSCGSAIDRIEIIDNSCEVFFPNIFTPNNDNKNDVFKILNVYNIKGFTLAIYNRWGEKVFETNDFLKGWNGYYKGQPAVLGSYVWHCNFNKQGSIKNLKGSVLLIR